MKVGLAFVNSMANAHPDQAIEIAQAAEESGFDSLWTVEHIVVPAGFESTYPYSRDGRMYGGEAADIAEPFVWLSFIAGVTRRITLATGITVLPIRRAAILAKQAATLQVLSRGRFQLGIGAGWLAEEFAALDVPFDDRGARTDDHIRAMRALWDQDVASYDGEFTRFSQVYARPLPSSPIPIVVGGHSNRAARRAGELGDGFFPGRVIEGELQGLLDTMRRTAEEAGRDPDGIEITLGSKPDPASIEARFAAGADRVLIPAMIGSDGIAMMANALGIG